MGRYLNVGLLQSESKDSSFDESLKRIELSVDNLMTGMNRPDIIVGPEMNIGLRWKGERSGDTIPGRVTDILGELARKHGIYLMVGSMLEVQRFEDGSKKLYNSVPIFNPQGELIRVYRKMCPYTPVEGNFTPGTEYVTFEIKEKKTVIGVLNCHDWCFPEISRNLALMGAEVLIRPAIDPEGLYSVCKSIPYTRAFENQAYFISVNMAGAWLDGYAYGHSVIAGPDGTCIYEAGSSPTALTVSLDLNKISDSRRYGTCLTEQLMRQYKLFNFSMPYAGHVGDAPLYNSLPDADMTLEQRDMRMKEELE